MGLGRGGGGGDPRRSSFGVERWQLRALGLICSRDVLITLPSISFPHFKSGSVISPRRAPAVEDTDWTPPPNPEKALRVLTRGAPLRLSPAPAGGGSSRGVYRHSAFKSSHWPPAARQLQPALITFVCPGNCAAPKYLMSKRGETKGWM